MTFLNRKYIERGDKMKIKVSSEQLNLLKQLRFDFDINVDIDQ